MTNLPRHPVCWKPVWNEAFSGTGLEHLLLDEGSADSVVVAVDAEHGAFRLAYRLGWESDWQLRDAELTVVTQRHATSMRLRTDGQGRWQDGEGRSLVALEGCRDIDIWPTPFTNSFPIRRERLAIGERRELRMAWVHGLDMTVHAQAQAYTRLAQRLYLFESLDGTGFKAELPVDEHGIVLDYPGLFRRVSSQPG